MRLKEYHIAYIPVAVLSVIFMLLSIPLKEVDSKFLPLLFGGVALLCCLIGIWRESSAEKQKIAAGKDPAEAEKEKTNWLHYIRDGAWLVGFILLIYLAGFLVAMPVYSLAYMRWSGTKWWVAITLTVVVTLGMYLSFERGVGVDLYRGILFGSRTW